MKKYHFPKWLGCAKKNFHFFQEKMDFWPFLRIFENHKNGQKSIFSWKKWKFFLAHPNHLGRWYFFISYTFQEGQVKGAKITNNHFCAILIFAVFSPKMGKKIEFYKIFFLTIFHWVFLDRNHFGHSSWNWVLYHVGAVFLRTVW